MAQTGVMQWLWLAIVLSLVLQCANARLLTENNSPAVAVLKDDAANLDVLDLSAGRHLLEVEGVSEDGATSEVCMSEQSSYSPKFSIRIRLLIKNHAVELRTYQLLMLIVNGLQLHCNRADEIVYKQRVMFANRQANLISIFQETMRTCRITLYPESAL